MRLAFAHLKSSLPYLGVLFLIPLPAHAVLPQVSISSFPYSSNIDSDVNAWGECSYGQTLQLNYPDGTSLFLGGQLEQGRPQHYQVGSAGYFCVGVLTSSGMVHTLETDGGPGGNPFRIALQKDGLEIIEELRDGAKRHPFLRHEISCQERQCIVTSPICVLNLPKTLHSGVMKDVDARRGNWANDGPSFYDLLDALLLRALTGDPEATQALLDHPFRVDGVTGEAFRSAQRTYKSSLEAGCPGLQK